MFKKTNRLSKKAAVLSALKNGRGFFNPYFNVRVLPLAVGKLRFAVVVSTKVDKRAVKRNRLKRVVRELLRSYLLKIKSGDYVIMLKPSAAKANEKLLIEEMEKSFIKWRLLN